TQARSQQISKASPFNMGYAGKDYDASFLLGNGSQQLTSISHSSSLPVRRHFELNSETSILWNPPEQGLLLTSCMLCLLLSYLGACSHIGSRFLPEKGFI
ncbi:hypothetical protein H1C71_037651, partial [Ictidomys tridecemlineatus]